MALVLVALLYVWSSRVASASASGGGVAGVSASASWAGGLLAVDVRVAVGAGGAPVEARLVNVSCGSATGAHVSLEPVYVAGSAVVKPGAVGGLAAVYSAPVEPSSCTIVVVLCSGGSCSSEPLQVGVAAGG